MFVVDDAAIATVVGTLTIVAALAKCTGDVVEAYRKIKPQKSSVPATANGAPLPVKGNSR